MKLLTNFGLSDDFNKRYNSHCGSVYGNDKRLMKKGWQGYLSLRQERNVIVSFLFDFWGIM